MTGQKDPWAAGKAAAGKTFGEAVKHNGGAHSPVAHDTPVSVWIHGWWVATRAETADWKRVVAYRIRYPQGRVVPKVSNVQALAVMVPETIDQARAMLAVATDWISRYEGRLCSLQTQGMR